MRWKIVSNMAIPDSDNFFGLTTDTNIYLHISFTKTMYLFVVFFLHFRLHKTNYTHYNSHQNNLCNLLLLMCSSPPQINWPEIKAKKRAHNRLWTLHQYRATVIVYCQNNIDSCGAAKRILNSYMGTNSTLFLSADSYPSHHLHTSNIFPSFFTQ